MTNSIIKFLAVTGISVGALSANSFAEAGKDTCFIVSLSSPSLPVKNARTFYELIKIAGDPDMNLADPEIRDAAIKHVIENVDGRDQKLEERLKLFKIAKNVLSMRDRPVPDDIAQIDKEIAAAKDKLDKHRATNILHVEGYCRSTVDKAVSENRPFQPIELGTLVRDEKTRKFKFRPSGSAPK
jgi:hypothetical protein